MAGCAPPPPAATGGAAPAPAAALVRCTWSGGHDFASFNGPLVWAFLSAHTLGEPSPYAPGGGGGIVPGPGGGGWGSGDGAALAPVVTLAVFGAMAGALWRARRARAAALVRGDSLFLGAELSRQQQQGRQQQGREQQQLGSSVRAAGSPGVGSRRWRASGGAYELSTTYRDFDSSGAGI